MTIETKYELGQEVWWPTQDLLPTVSLCPKCGQEIGGRKWGPLYPSGPHFINEIFVTTEDTGTRYLCDNDWTMEEANMWPSESECWAECDRLNEEQNESASDS